MKKSLNQALMSIIAFTIIMTISGMVFADPVTLVGTVTEDWQFQGADGMTYQIGDTEVGVEVLDKIGKKVELKGNLTEDDTGKIINIESYTILEE